MPREAILQGFLDHWNLVPQQFAAEHYAAAYGHGGPRYPDLEIGVPSEKH